MAVCQRCIELPPVYGRVHNNLRLQQGVTFLTEPAPTHTVLRKKIKLDETLL